MHDGESKDDKYNRGLDLFIESVLKPDSKLRQCAHNQKCYHELMEIRETVLTLSVLIASLLNVCHQNSSVDTRTKVSPQTGNFPANL